MTSMPLRPSWVMAASVAAAILGAGLLVFAFPPVSWAAIGAAVLGIALLVAAVRIWPQRRPAR